jgi:hypothetical protein
MNTIVHSFAKNFKTWLTKVQLIVLLTGFLWPVGTITAQARQLAPWPQEQVGLSGLSLQDRIRCQQAIEQVYWQHRIWPQENPGPKPELSTILPPDALQAKVDDYLQKSNALQIYWGQPISGEMMQAELDRMAQNTRQPQVLQELWAALDNDPARIAECLARPLLADRLIRSWYTNDEQLHQPGQSFET